MENLKWWQVWKLNRKIRELQEVIKHAKHLHSKDLDKLHSLKLENARLNEFLNGRPLPANRSRKV